MSSFGHKEKKKLVDMVNANIILGFHFNRVGSVLSLTCKCLFKSVAHFEITE